MVQKETTPGGLWRSGVSVIIPAYNAAKWLKPTTGKIDFALQNAEIGLAEIIIIDDGSTDRTYEIAKTLTASVPIRVLTHPNQGRFLTRKRGVYLAKYDTIFFVDTRVWIDEGALKYIDKQQRRFPERRVWNGDVQVHKNGNLIARFGDAVTHIGWRRYYVNPRLVSYDTQDFDYYPKGTGMFLTPRRILLEAIDWFESQTTDIRYSSDDTLLIRYIAEKERIWISPKFTCVYFSRSTLKEFITHTYHRGIFFVDGFLRPGTRFYYPLIAFLVLCPVILLTLIVLPALIYWIALGTLVVWIIELIVAVWLRIGIKDALALFLLSPVFALFYGAGIWKAVVARRLRHETNLS